MRYRFAVLLCAGLTLAGRALAQCPNTGNPVGQTPSGVNLSEATPITFTWSCGSTCKAGTYYLHAYQAGNPIGNPAQQQLVLDQQERVAESQRAEAEAIANYNIAIAKLEQAKGTLLRYNNIVMEQERTPFTQKVRASIR